MAKGRNQKLKLMYIAKILLEKTDENHYLTRQEIIDELATYEVEAERKSIYDDIQKLNEYGMDISCFRTGRTYGYQVLTREFHSSELKLLVDAVQASKFISEAKSQELIKKLESLTSRHEGRSLQRQVYMIGRPKTPNENVLYAVDTIHTAIMENKQISFKYFSWNTKKEMEFRHDGALYEVSPWSMCWDSENYYMLAYDSKDEKLKHYRVDKMVQVNTMDKVRKGKEVFEGIDLAAYTQRFLNMYEAQVENVKLSFDNSLINVVLDRYGKDIMLIPQKDGTFHVNLQVATSDLFLGWLIGFGNKVEVLAPESVRTRLKEAGQALLERYKE